MWHYWANLIFVWSKVLISVVFSQQAPGFLKDFYSYYEYDDMKLDMLNMSDGYVRVQ